MNVLSSGRNSECWAVFGARYGGRLSDRSVTELSEQNGASWYLDYPTFGFFARWDYEYRPEFDHLAATSDFEVRGELNSFPYDRKVSIVADNADGAAPKRTRAPSGTYTTPDIRPDASSATHSPQNSPVPSS